MDLKKISKRIIKRIFRIVSQLVLMIFFPTRKLIEIVFGFSLQMIRLTSHQRSLASGEVFEYYYAKNSKAKQEKSSVSIPLSVKSISTLSNMAKLTIITSYCGIFGIYLINMFLIPIILTTLIYKISPQNLGTAVAVSTLLMAYYLILISYIGIKYIMGSSIDREHIKIYLAKDFEYIYIKTSEIDEEIANMTMTQIVKSLLLEQDNKIKINEFNETLRKA